MADVAAPAAVTITPDAPAVATGGADTGAGSGQGANVGTGSGNQDAHVDTGAQGSQDSNQGVADKFSFDFDGEKFDGAEDEVDAAGGATADPANLDPKFKEILKDNPELYKSVERAHYENREYRKLFANPKEAKEFKAQVDDIGGIEKAKAEIEESSTRYASLQAGDPAIVETYWSEAPESMAKLSGKNLDMLQSTNPDVYNYEITGRFMNLLRAPLDDQGHTFLGLMNDLWAASGDNAAAKDMLKKLGGYVNQLSDISKSKPDFLKDGVADTTKGKREGATQYVQGVTKKAQGYIQDGIKQAVKQATKGLRLNAEQERDLQLLAAVEWDNITGKDQKFISDGKAFISAQQDRDFYRFIQQRIAKETPKIARAIAKRYAGRTEEIKRDAQSRVETQKGNSSSQAAKVKYNGAKYPGTNGPDPRQIDRVRMRTEFGKDKTESMIADNQFYIKGQKPLYFVA